MTDAAASAGASHSMRLELVPVPVTDVDRARAFYVEKVGFRLDHDARPSGSTRIVQLTPPGSACSILIGTGLGEITAMVPGAVKGLHLVVDDIARTRAEMIGRGVPVEDVRDLGGILFARFEDPDGNSWMLQEIPPRFRKGA
jgi:catechol 2,3-dioxygenase-like lactoylglutathione lyase family enzyme